MFESDTAFAGRVLHPLSWGWTKGTASIPPEVCPEPRDFTRADQPHRLEHLLWLQGGLDFIEPEHKNAKYTHTLPSTHKRVQTQCSTEKTLSKVRLKSLFLLLKSAGSIYRDNTKLLLCCVGCRETLRGILGQVKSIFSSLGRGTPSPSTPVGHKPAQHMLC